MQVIISVKRTTRYSSVVEMSREDFDRLNAALERGDRDEEKDAKTA